VRWTTEDARSLAERILALSGAESCQVSLELTDSSHTRFAANEVTTAGRAHDLTISITSRMQGKSGTVRTNDTATDALRRAVALSEELMALAPPDPEALEDLGAQQYPAIPAAFDDPTWRAGAVERRGGVRAALEAARSLKLNGSGFFETEARWSAIANKKGLFGFHRETEASYSTTMRTADGTGSGWAGAVSPRLATIRAEDLARRAATKAQASATPRDLEPGIYTVILEPQAVSDLLGSLGFALSARAADEGRSYFAKPGGGNRVGERVFAETVTVYTDPADPRRPGRPWSGAGGGGGGGGRGGGGSNWGLPARRVSWVEKGVLQALAVDRYWATKTEREPLPFSGTAIMEGGTGSVDDLVAGCDRGLLVTRFWYIRSVNPQTLQVTGLTRDGVWLVEKGQVVAPVNNFRFNDSPAKVLQNVEALSAAETTGRWIVPGIRARGFNFSSKSDAV
jgi:predicted Zn-dependent protease